MRHAVDEILDVLDRCCDHFTFPMLDNGYVYLAATRLTLHRSPLDWAIVIEVFGFSPREGDPSTYVQTFGSRLENRRSAEQYVSDAAYRTYLATNANNEHSPVFPILDRDWIDEHDGEHVAPDATHVMLRNHPWPLPTPDEYARHGIVLEQPDGVRVFELCRYLAAVARGDVLATATERRVNVPAELAEVLLLDEWTHPNVVDDSERPSGSETFRQLATVLTTGDATAYRPTTPPNTHWSNWPEGGTL